MADEEAPSTAPERGKEAGWHRHTRRALITVSVLGLCALGILIGAAFVPRWWAHRVGDQVDGSIASGTLIGLAYGFLFTLLPVAVIGAALRWARSWRSWMLALAGAALLALPNLMTLGIVLGVGNAAHAGDRTLDVEAPAFRGATLAGAIIAILVAGFVAYLALSRRRTRAALASSRAAIRREADAEQLSGNEGSTASTDESR